MPLHPVGRDWRQLTSCLIFSATLGRDTKRIKVGSGTVNLANRHPAATAAERHLR